MAASVGPTSDQVNPNPSSETSVLRLIDAYGTRWSYRVLRAIADEVLRVLFRVQINGTVNVPASGPFVVAANHLSWLDAPLLVIAFPRSPRINFVADATFVTDSSFRWFMGRLIGGVLPLVTKGHGIPPASHVIQACLAIGGAVGFFPEGRYANSEAEPLRFHRGFAKAAIEANVPIVPVRVSGTRPLWLRRRVLVEILPPIYPAGETADTLAVVTREAVASVQPVDQPPPRFGFFSRLLTRLFP